MYFSRMAHTADSYYRHNKNKDEELFIYDDQTGSAKIQATANGNEPGSSQAKGDQFKHGQETVMFPGVNAPIPAGAELALWVRWHTFGNLCAVSADAQLQGLKFVQAQRVCEKAWIISA